MLEEAAQELLRREGHGALLAAVRIVLPAKSDLGVGDREQAMVGDGDPVGITGQIVKDMLGSAEGRLGIDDPLLLEQSTQKSCEAQSARCEVAWEMADRRRPDRAASASSL